MITFDENTIYKELIETKYENINFDILIQEKDYICMFDENELVSIAQFLYELMKINKSLLEDVLDEELMNRLTAELEL